MSRCFLQVRVDRAVSLMASLSLNISVQRTQIFIFSESLFFLSCRVYLYNNLESLRGIWTIRLLSKPSVILTRLIFITFSLQLDYISSVSELSCCCSWPGACSCFLGKKTFTNLLCTVCKREGADKGAQSHTKAWNVAPFNSTVGRGCRGSSWSP